MSVPFASRPAPTSLRRMRRLALLLGTVLGAVACAGGEDIPAEATGGYASFTGGFGGSAGSGDGSGGSGGGASSNGGTPGNGGAQSDGGSANGGSSGDGGAIGSGGASDGGASNGGAAGADAGSSEETGGDQGSDGGAGNGGSIGSGGASDGGASNGGSIGSGGASNGGAGSGGASNGGASSGGASSGGASSGGSGSGGLGSGGASDGGAANGGAGNGGASAGGSSNGGSAGSGGAGGGGGGGGAGGQGGACATPLTNPGYVNLAPPMGAPLDDVGTTLNPPAPTGWTWYQIDGAVCRDGSPAGFFLHKGTTDKLLWYLEGGGACISPGFCNSFNPANVNQAISGSGETVLGSAFGVVAVRQQPGIFESNVVHGIFDWANAANPFKDWSMIYAPYCTGDAWFGAQPDGTVPGVAAKQQFVGYLNMKKFVSRVVPTFQGKLSRVVLTGASAGGFGAALNFSMVQDAFGCTRVDVLDDSGPPFVDQYMPACMQKKWRTLWGFANSLPPDCAECNHADGGGILNLADFLLAKHPVSKIALVSSMNDEVIRLFYSPGLKDCVNFDTADPVGITVGQVLDPTIYMTAANYGAGLLDLRSRYQSTGRFATYFLGGANITFHQHIWRARFFDPAAGTETIAAFTTRFLNDQIDQIGP
ncbi:MAG TPA: pectin acetylesterase-family hydrolase [Polyangiaceae bacterium]|nr:pectin acetylesterase-family hydrolase [Polyangiaceae bacterium]